MADYGQFQIGKVTFPLTSSTTNSLLQDADPALYYALDYFVLMLQTHLGARFNAAVTNAGLPELDGYVVKYALPYDPTPELLSQQMTFPLFAIWEESTKEEPKTLTWYHSVATWKAIYVLPALTGSQRELLNPFLKSVKNVIVDRTVQGHDPAYRNNLIVWDVDVSGIEKIRVTESRQAPFLVDPSTNLFLPTLLLTFDVLIRQNSNSQFFSKLDRVDTTQQLNGYELLDLEIPIA